MTEHDGPFPGPCMQDQVAVVVGAGQTPGTTIGNGRATALMLAREGATVLAVDRDLDSAAETAAMIEAEGGSASIPRADVTSEEDCRNLVSSVTDLHDRIDVLVKNVGIGTGDAGPTDLSVEAWDLIQQVNLRGSWLTSKYTLPVMTAQGSGSVVNMSSAAAVCAAPMLAWAVSKAGVNSLTQQLAMSVASAVVFLASSRARFITGVVLPVDGGQQAKVG